MCVSYSAKIYIHLIYTPACYGFTCTRVLILTVYAFNKLYLYTLVYITISIAWALIRAPSMPMIIHFILDAQHDYTYLYIKLVCDSSIDIPTVLIL